MSEAANNDSAGLEKSQQRIEELAEANRRLEELLPKVAHDLRNRLAPLRNGLHILRMPNVQGAARDGAIDLMEQQLQKLGQIADELATASRVQPIKVVTSVTGPGLPECGDLAPTAIQAAPGTNQSDHRPLRILVVEDSEPVAVMLVTLLEMRGHHVQAAANGPDALAMARTNRPDVVFLDLGLPGISGHEVAKQLRAESPVERHEKIVIAALTGNAGDEDRRRSRQAGCDYHLVKPIDPRTVEAILGSVEMPAVEN